MKVVASGMMADKLDFRIIVRCPIMGGQYHSLNGMLIHLGLVI